MRSSPPCHEQGHLPLDHVCYEVNRCTFWHLFLAQMSFKSKKVLMRVFTPPQKQKFHLKKKYRKHEIFQVCGRYLVSEELFASWFSYLSRSCYKWHNNVILLIQKIKYCRTIYKLCAIVYLAFVYLANQIYSQYSKCKSWSHSSLIFKHPDSFMKWHPEQNN